MKRFAVLLFCVVTIASGTFLGVVYSQSGGGSVTLDARVPGCGDGIIDPGEDCDALNLNNKTCATQSFSSGSISCTASCTLNTSACVISSGGGGSGKNTKAQVVLSGRAYPKSTVTVLKDAQVVATTVADEDARFQVNITGLSSGSYIFSTYSEDLKGIRSSLLTFPVSVTKGILAKIENIFVAPTIAVDKREVKKGDLITIFGQSTPSSEITLEVYSGEQFFEQTKADASGAYLYRFDTSVLEVGQHHTKSRSVFAGAVSTQSAVIPFTVGDNSVPETSVKNCPTKADMNNDCRVDLSDFSIALFWYNRPLSAEFILRERATLSGDATVTLTDFSTMAFYWTG